MQRVQRAAQILHMTNSAAHRDLRGATEVPRTDSSGERCRASRSQGRAAAGVPVKWSAQADRQRDMQHLRTVPVQRGLVA